MSLRALALSLVVVVVAVVAAGCATNGGNGVVTGADAAAPGDDAGAPCVGAACVGLCVADADCRGSFKCDLDRHVCVECLADGDCARGRVCAPVSHICTSGCSIDHPCAQGSGVCEPDAGVCVECAADGDCKDPAKPRCSPSLRRCVACNPKPDDCPAGQYCGAQGCTAGCKDDADCIGDGGVGGGGTHCDPRLRVCTACVADGDCVDGMICRTGSCVPGCSQQRPCPMGQSCCNAECSDVKTDGFNCGACGMACPGGWACCAGACTNAVGDVNNCGGCGLACVTPNATPSCAGRQCAIGQCQGGWGDCNGVARDGCETHVDNNPANCGACGNYCSIPHAFPRCGGGMCQIDTCLYPFADCNGNLADGCEANIESNDVDNCGGCGNKCTFNHTKGLCQKGSCHIISCDFGFADCNNDPADGCEVDLLDDPANCGLCRTSCSVANGAAACKLGKCAVGNCNAGFADCNNNLGDGCEVDINDDLNNCGKCQNACPVPANAAPICSMGRCGIASCNAGFADCNNNAGDGCEVNTQGDANNCGACGNVCANGGFCAGGVCVVSPECANYTLLDDASRSVNNGGGGGCDNGMQTQWYRFSVNTGVRLPTAPPPTSRCGTDAPGWLNGAYPPPGQSVGRQVCFNWGSQCQWSTQIQVTNCGAYYVFKLGPTPTCSLRYCGTNN